MKNKIKKNICAIITVGYHLLFLGGTTTLVNGYLDEIAQLRLEIQTQGDKARNTVKDIESTAKDLEGSVKKMTKELEKVKKACGKIF